MAALQASRLSRDQMLDNIHYFRVRDYTEQVSTLCVCADPCEPPMDLQEWSHLGLDHKALFHDLSL